MKYEVILTADAADDLEHIYDYIKRHDRPGKADYVLGRIERVLQGLATFSKRGSYPRELQRLGIREYRQTLFNPYRIIYRVQGKKVYVYLIADGRRNMQTLLARRMLGP